MKPVLDRISHLTRADIRYIKEAEFARFEQVFGKCEVCAEDLPANHSWVFAHTETKTCMNVEDRARKFICICVVLHTYETNGRPSNLEESRCVSIFIHNYEPGAYKPFWSKYLEVNGNWWER